MNIGVIGVGVVGRALVDYYAERGHLVLSYDKASDDVSALDRVRELAEVVFICVGTASDPETGMLDCSQVFAAVDALGEQRAGKTVVIKSTVMPGTTDAIQEAHPEDRVFFIPEFLDADTALADYTKPHRSHVIGVGNRINETDGTDGTMVPEELLFLLPYKGSLGWRRLPARQAELLKLATNAFYALKVTFANEMFDLGMEQETLDALAADPRIGDSHFMVFHKDYRGFGGACLPKDTKALHRYGAEHGYAVNLLCHALIYNDELRKESDG